jgi:hypothetical protein
VPPLRNESALAAQFVADALQSLGLDQAELPPPSEKSPDELLSWLAARLDSGRGVGGAGELADQLRTRFAVFSAHSRLLAGYEPVSDADPVRAPALIVSASDSLNAPAADRWAQVLAGPVKTLRVTGDHYSFLRPPTVTEVAAALLTSP